MGILKTKVSYSQIIAKLESFFKDIGKDPNVLEDIGKFSLERIRATVRSGYSLDGDKKHKLKKLSESYKDVRRGALKFRNINGKTVVMPEADERLKEVDVQFFDPDLSNLTFTGQLMKALGFKTQPSRRSVIVEVEDSSRKGKYEKLTNKEVAKHVSDNGRPFLGLDKTGVARINAIVKAFIRKEIIKQRLRKR